MVLRATGGLDPDPSTWTPNHQLIGVEPDQMLPLRQSMQVRVFDMDHSVPCCGYGFYDTRQKLKKEYEGLPGKEIAALRRTDPNLQISEERLVPQFVFLGDTTASVFEKYGEELLRFPVIIVECSFIDHEQHGQRAADVKHVIWVSVRNAPLGQVTCFVLQTDLHPYVAQHPEITFVLIHFSQQYTVPQIKEFFTKLNLPNVVPFV
jgi:hypothetical protein